MTPILADLSSFMGSVWFSVMLGVGGYLIGNIMPLSWVASKFKK